MTPQFETVRKEYAVLWKGMAVRPERLREVERTARRVLKEREKYQTVASATKVPWFVVGLIHAMEAGLSFDDHLHNGDPLDERTVHVPRGRPKQGNPPFTWEQSAIDALHYDGLDCVDNWCVERIAYMLETYNGFGYRSQRVPIPSPYLWSATNIYTKGKYVRDSVYDPNAVSEQSGAMAILSVMRDLEPGIVLTYFDGDDAVHDAKTVAALEPGASTGKKPISVLTGDVITTASGAGLLATVMAHTPAAGTSSAPATPTIPAALTAEAPPAASAVVQPAAPPAQTAPPTALPQQQSAAPHAVATQTAKPVLAPHTAPKTLAKPVQHQAVTVQPANAFVQFVDSHYQALLGGFGALFVLGIAMALRARRARKQSGQSFETALPQLLRAAASGDLTSAPLVKSLKARALTIAWVAATIVINVIAFAKLLQQFHLAPSGWYPPFSWLGGLYDRYAVQGFHILSEALSKQWGYGLESVPWLLPFIVLYAATASAFMLANSALMKRQNSAEGFWGAIVHAGWLLAVPLFLLDAIRYRVVTRFARQNSLLFVAYIASFICCYIAARFINDEFLAPYLRQNPAAVAQVTHEVQKDLASANALLQRAPPGQ